MFALMSKPSVPTRKSGDIFDKLAHRGIRDYWAVKRIVSFQIPQAEYFFVQQYKHRTVADVLDQIERWKEFLNRDFVLLASQRAEIVRWINQTELLTCNALIQANSPRIGVWEMRYEWSPTGKDEFGHPIFIWPALRITARNRDT